MHDVRLSLELDSLRFERGVDCVNVGNPEIDRGSSLRFLSRGHDAHEQAYSAAIEKSHLRRRGEEKRNPQRVTVKRDTALEIDYGNEQLRYPGVGEVHPDDGWLSLRQTRRRFGRRRVGFDTATKA